MVALPSLLLSPDESRDRNGPVTPTLNGGVITVPGQYGDAWQIAEATMNLHTRPIPTNASGGLRGWYSAVSTGSERNLALDTEFEPSLGPWRLLEITTVGAPAHTFHHSARMDIDASGTYTASLYIATSREMTVPIYAKVGNSWGIELAAKTVTLGPTPKRVELTFSATAGQEVHWGFLHTMNTYSPLEGDKFWVSRAQLEAKPYATPYCDGSLGAGHAWTGTPHASASTREAASVTLPVDWDLKNGSFILRMRQTGEAIHNGYIMNIGSWGTQQNMRVMANGSGHPTMRMRSGDLAQSTIYAPPQQGGYLWLNPVTLYGDWTEDTHRFREGLEEFKTADRIIGEAPNAQLLTIGSGSQPSQMVFESILFFDTALTDAEIAMISRMSRWKWEYFVPPTPIPPPPPRPPITAEMTDLRPYPIMATIAGHPTDVISYNRSHGVDQPVATGSITLPLPLPEHLRGGAPGDVLNLPISMQVGYRESILRPVFNGYIRRDRMELSRNGNYATLSLVGYATLLAWPESRDLEFSSNILLEEIIRSLCARRGVPKYRIDRIMTPSGARVRMGGNSHIDDGKVIIPAGTSPLDWMTRLLRLFGYRAFDTAQEFRVQRVSGRPTLGPMGDFAEGKLIHRLSRDRDLDDVVTAYTVEGATYTDDDGIQIPIRSIPAGTVPFEPLLNPPGYREATIRDNQLVTQVNADTVRQIAEIDNATVNPMWSINTRGNSLYRPGATVRIASSNMEAAAENYWLMSVKDALDSRQGYKAVLTAWKGGGTALPDGEDLETINVREAPIHLGDEYVPWYAVPQATGKEFSIPITVPDTYTSLAISLYLHGSNNYLLGEGNTESTVSKIEVWQKGEEVGSTELPVSPEDYERQLPYGSGLTHWQQFRLPVPGRLEAGSAEIKIVSGEDKRLPESTKWDDFEARNIMLELRGAGVPELPTQGGGG